MRLTVLSLATVAVAVSACSDNPVQPTTQRAPGVNGAVQAAAAIELGVSAASD